MWEPTPYDQDPFDLGDGPPAPLWALHAPEGETETALPVPPAQETASAQTLVETTDVHPILPALPDGPPPALESQPPRTVLLRLSQLAAPIKVERAVPPPPSALPLDVDRMEDALAGLERQITQPRPVVETPAFLLPSLMDRIRSARLKAGEPALPLPIAPEPESVAQEPRETSGDSVTDEATDEIDLPLFMAGAGFAEEEPPPFPAAFEELPPPPFFTKAEAELPVAVTAELGPEALATPVEIVEVAARLDAEPEPRPLPVDGPAAAAAESKAATRHLESLVAALDGEINSGLALTPQPETPAALALPVADAGRYVVFYLGNTRYGLAIGEVLEMATVPRTTPLPNVPDFIRGVANLRGEVLAVIDLRTLLTLEAASDTLRERLLVVRAPQGDAVAGFIVDSVRGLARVGERAVVQPSMPLNTRAAEFLQGVSSYEDQLLNVLDTRKLFAAPEIAELSAS